MRSWWYTLFIVVFSSYVNSKIDLESNIAIARCRASCLLKMKSQMKTDLDCLASLDCSQCWGACAGDDGPLCDHSDCVPGSSTLVAPSPPEEVLSLSLPQVSWPPLPGAVVYVVMVDGSQLRHTLQPRVTLPSTADPATVRVLAVDWRGQVRVLAPVAESPVDRAMHVLRSLGLEGQLGLGIGNDSQGEVSTNTSNLKVVLHTVWKLKVDSVHHQPPLVQGKISWRRYHYQLIKTKQLTSYLVTWSVHGGALRGNLLTNSSTVSLTLVPDTVYRIQVSLLNQRYPPIQSEVLSLDTHSFYKFNYVPAVLQRGITPRNTSLVSSIEHYKQSIETPAVIILYLIVVLLIPLRWRYKKFRVITDYVCFILALSILLTLVLFLIAKERHDCSQKKVKGS